MSSSHFWISLQYFQHIYVAIIATLKFSLAKFNIWIMWTPFSSWLLATFSHNLFLSMYNNFCCYWILDITDNILALCSVIFPWRVFILVIAGSYWTIMYNMFRLVLLFVKNLLFKVSHSNLAGTQTPNPSYVLSGLDYKFC